MIKHCHTLSFSQYLNCGLIKFPPNQPLGIEDGVGGVHGDLVLGGVADEPLGVSEGDVGGGGAVTLVIGDDFHLAVLEHSDTGVGGAQVNTNSYLLGHLCLFVF